MPLPKPPVALDDICSVIWNNTLYTYSPHAFQALPLTPGGNWTQLPQGEKVTGAACVGSTPGDAQVAGFYVVGGKGANQDYQGLQKFTYATGKWESIKLEAPVTQQRLWHGAAYLPASDSILIYAGAQDGAQNPSTQTFTVGASAPHTVLSFQSSAPPAINPILLPWSDSEAVLVGGSATNKQVFVFSPASSWYDSGASLAAPLEKDVTAMKATLVKGDDGCKNLYTFDMTTSPNAVTRTVLINGQGQPVQNSPRIDTRSEAKRDGHSLTLGDWPKYNATLAPKATRTNYALAQDTDDLVVIAGGNKDDVLCMFDGRENGWQNATARLADQKVFATDTTSTSSTSSATPTSTSLLSGASSSTTSNPTAAAAAPVGIQNDGSGLGTNTLLGIVFGSVFGAAIILTIIYLCIRRKRSHLAYLEAGHMRRASGVSSPEKDSIVFANDSLTRDLSGKGGVFRGHHQQESGNSFSSMAILMGKVNQQNHHNPPGVNRSASDRTKRSSSSSIFNKAFKSTISKPIPQMTETMGPAPPRPAPESRDEKSAAYAANSTVPRSRASNAAGAGAGAGDRRDSMRRSSGWNRYWSGGSALNILGFGSGNAAAAQKRVTVESDRSSEYSNVSAHRITQDSATVPPLNVYEPRASFSRVTRGSPTISTYDKEVKEGLSGRIERPVSAVSDLSGYSSGIPASVHEAWDPTTMQKPWGTDRAPSSAYATTFTPSAAPAPPAARPVQPPTGVSRQPQLAMAATSDMSWLNLGDHNGP